MKSKRLNKDYSHLTTQSGANKMNQPMFIKTRSYWGNWFNLLLSLYYLPSDLVTVWQQAFRGNSLIYAFFEGIGVTILTLILAVLIVIFGPFLALFGYEPNS